MEQNASRTERFKQDFKERLQQVKTTRWWRFGLVALLYTAWVIWMQSWWWLLGLVLLFDIYLTGYIPFTWWKQSKSKIVRTLMSWVDAIVYALVLVYFVFSFVGQNYQIPSSSLEKTLLTGDYLFVNKMTYGPRVPMTPVHFPLVHNTMPGFLGGGDSYLDSPSVKYRRLKGLRSVESGDIVVFNFPAGDTVLTNNPSTLDYYQLCAINGRDVVNRHTEFFGTKRYYPVDRRENYVKRVVGLPGQHLKIVDGTIYIDGKPQDAPVNVQHDYIVATDGTTLGDELWKELDVTPSDIHLIQYTMDPNTQDYYDIILNGLTRSDLAKPHYKVPLTQASLEALKSNRAVTSVTKASPQETICRLYPFGLSQQWDRDNYAMELNDSLGLLIPRKGMRLAIDDQAWEIYERAIRVYEDNPDAHMRDGKLYIGGKPVDEYEFTMDYYFMMGDNRDRSLDSRYWGFVPEDHVVGTPWRVLISFDGERGGVRWNRIFKDANPDK